ncbi:MAG: GntR family transcriptional regulator [Pseudaminobacter sp.]
MSQAKAKEGAASSEQAVDRTLSRVKTRPSGIARTTAATAVYRELHAAIVSMQIRPGTSLNEKALTERFGVSRTPVREALIRLVEDGLVNIYPQSGTFVAPIPTSIIPEAVVIRKALEGATVERAAACATAEDMARLDDILARQRFLAGRQDMNGFHEADEAFHEAIAGIAKYPGIWDYLKPIKVQIDRARRLTLPALGRMEHVIGEHQIIRDAIASHDVKAAAEAMEIHLGAVIPDVEELRDTYPDCFI